MVVGATDGCVAVLAADTYVTYTERRTATKMMTFFILISSSSFFSDSLKRCGKCQSRFLISCFFFFFFLSF